MMIGISGGIGSGKSVVSRILRIKGYEVYDCDWRAKRIMDDSQPIKQAICDRLGRECIDPTGALRRDVIAQRVFADPQHLKWLNELVHSHVRNEIQKWSCGKDPVFVESAILHSSGIAAQCDAIWIVTAPDELRIERAMQRSALTRSQVLDRINAQRAELEPPGDLPTIEIINDGSHSLLRQIDALLPPGKS